MDLLSYEVENTHSGRGFDPHHLHQKEINVEKELQGHDNEEPPSPRSR